MENTTTTKLVVTMKSFNVRSRRVEGWFAETADKRYSAERSEDEGTPWIVRCGDTVLAWTGSLSKAQRIVERHSDAARPACLICAFKAYKASAPAPLSLSMFSLMPGRR